MTRNDTTVPERDEQLGALLGALEVPSHAPGFDAALRRRLALEHRRARHRATRRWSVRAAAAVAAVAVAIAVIGLPKSARTPSLAGPGEAQAALVKARVRTALSDLHTLAGVLVATGPGRTAETRWGFTLDAAGDLRLAGPTAGDTLAYDAATGVVRSAEHSASLGGGTLFYSERTGVAPGAPDQGPPTWVLPEEYGAFVRAALAAGSPVVSQTTYRGRAAWALEVDTEPSSIVPGFSGDHLRIVVDQATGMPIRVVETKHGTVLRELRIDDLAVDAPVAAGTFRLAFPASVEVMHSDDGFRRVELGALSAAVGYRPLIPAWVPDGYQLAEVAVARSAAPTGNGNANPPSRMVVSLSYRRGLDQLLVTTRLRGGSTWADPLATGEGYADRPQPTTIASGALAGADAQLVVTPRGLPHLWATTSDLVVTVAGNVGAAELTRVAGSLVRRS